jgi:DNA-binding SARP family transcriptional activator/DNA-binding CsgD family transcriptional regulator
VAALASLRIQLLGGFRVTRGEQTLLDYHCRQRRAAALIKLLALAPSRRLHREQVMDTLWPDLPPDAAANNLNFTVYTARRLLGTSEGQCAPYLLRDGQYLTIGPERQVWVDVSDFERAAAVVGSSDDRATCEQAVVMYTGELLPEDRYEEWLVDRRAALQSRYVSLLCKVARFRSEDGDYGGAIEALQQVLEVEPSDEGVHTDLMRLYAVNGQRTKALAQYQRLTLVLKREMETEPSPASQALRTAIAQRQFPPNSTAAVADLVTKDGLPTHRKHLERQPPPTQPPLLVGRDLEQSILRERLAQSEAGEGGLVMISGEAGIGKTALAQAIAWEASTLNMLVLTGYCYDLTATPPYGPWLTLARRYRSDGDLPAFPQGLLAVEQSRAVLSQATLFEEVQAFLTLIAERRPLLVILEDLHWSDLVSLEMLRYIARTLPVLPILMAVTYRIDEVTRNHPLHRLEPVLAREASAERIRLRRLDEAGLRSLVRGRHPLVEDDEERLVEHLKERTHGNPLYAREVLRTLVDDGVLRQGVDRWVLGDPSGIPVPRLIRQLIEGRLSRLGEETRRLLGVAAVIGQVVSVEVWSRVAQVEDNTLIDAIEGVLDAHLLEDTLDGQRLRFSHSLVREALYHDVSLPRRQQWHRRVAEVLADLPAPAPDTIAHHFQQAGDQRAVDWLMRAGDRAERAYAWRTAAARFATASDILDGNDNRALDRGWLLYRAAQIRMFSNPPEGIKELDEALRVAMTIGDSVLHAISLFRRGHLRCFAGAIRHGLDEMLEGLGQLETLCDRKQELAEYARSLTPEILAGLNRGVLVLWLAAAGRYREAIEHGEPHLLSSPPPSNAYSSRFSIGWIDTYDWANAYRGLGEAYAMAGTLPEARAKLEYARAAFHAADTPTTVSDIIQSILSHLILPYQTDRVNERRRLAQEMEEAWSRGSGAMPPGKIAGIQSIQLLALEGAWNEVRDVVIRGRTWQMNVARRSYLMWNLGMVARAQGDVDLAWEQVREALPEGPHTQPGNCFFLPGLGPIQVGIELSLDDGDLDQARLWLTGHERWLEWSGSLLGRTEGHLLWARYHYAAEDRERARESATTALRIANDPRQPLALIGIHRFLGELDTESRHFDDSRKHLSVSLALAEACEVPFERALTLLGLAELGVATKDIDGALSLLTEVRAIFEPLGAQPSLARTDELITRLAMRGAKSATPGGLTSREIQVLRLITQGKTDREIADTLFISHHTVRRHVSHILDKLGVDSRTAAAAFAVRNNLV